jgi:hypothetical protein
MIESHIRSANSPTSIGKSPQHDAALTSPFAHVSTAPTDCIPTALSSATVPFFTQAMTRHSNRMSTAITPVNGSNGPGVTGLAHPMQLQHVYAAATASERCITSCIITPTKQPRGINLLGSARCMQRTKCRETLACDPQHPTNAGDSYCSLYKHESSVRLKITNTQEHRSPTFAVARLL